jgi:cysteinyl-tRNA synthetase
MQGGKMSKTVGNIVTLRELLPRGLSPRAIRLFLISAHYREELKFSDASLAQATATLGRFDQLIRRLKAVQPRETRAANPEANVLSAALLSSFEESLDDDLNLPKALAAFFIFERKLNSLLDSGNVSKADSNRLLETLRRVDSVLGVMETESPLRKGAQSDPESSLIADLVAQREDARRRKEFQKADEIRDDLTARGVVVEDTPTGPVWHRLSTPS